MTAGMLGPLASRGTASPLRQFPSIDDLPQPIHLRGEDDDVVVRQRQRAMTAYSSALLMAL